MPSKHHSRDPAVTADQLARQLGVVAAEERRISLSTMRVFCVVAGPILRGEVVRLNDVGPMLGDDQSICWYKLRTLADGNHRPPRSRGLGWLHIGRKDLSKDWRQHVTLTDTGRNVMHALDHERVCSPQGGV